MTAQEIKLNNHINAAREIGATCGYDVSVRVSQPFGIKRFWHEIVEGFKLMVRSR